MYEKFAGSGVWTSEARNPLLNDSRFNIFDSASEIEAVG
jgi:hypothetical protein